MGIYLERVGFMIIYIILWSCFGICIIGGFCGPVSNLYYKYKLKFLLQDFKEKMCEYIEGPEGIAIKLAGEKLDFKYKIPRKKIFFFLRSKKFMDNLASKLRQEIRLSYIGDFIHSKYNITIFYKVLE